HRVSPDHSSGTLVEVNCESDFVARTPDFQQLIEDVLNEIEQAGEAASDAWLKDLGGVVQTRMAATIGKLGGNMAVPRFVRNAGRGYVGQYVHPGGKIVVMVEFTDVAPSTAERAEFTSLVKEIAMQVAAASPQYVSRQSVPAEVLEKERG